MNNGCTYISDLLVDPSRAHALHVRESPEVGVFVEGLSRHRVGSAHDVESLIASGTKYRTIASTKYNRESSRSHAVFEITLIQVFKEKNNPLILQKKSKVNLIDLAGSERTGKIGNKGIVFDEGASINKSLTVLGRCIKALSKMKRGSGGKSSANNNKIVSVPFRESVLTWYLRESLAGNSKTTMLATVSPADSNGNETYGTLRYAAEAKRIETVVHMNEDAVQKQLRQQQEEIMKLREQLDRLERQLPADANASEVMHELRADYELKYIF
jgi:kinesin family member 1